MFDDDNHKDYFLDDEEPPQERRPDSVWGDWDSDHLPPELRKREEASARPDSEDFDDYDDFAEPEDKKGLRAAGKEQDGSALRRRGWNRGASIGCLGVIVLSALGIGYFRYGEPCVEDAVMEVCVRNVERRGLIFKTYEADVVMPPDMAPEEMERRYSGPRPVTIESARVARELQSPAMAGRPVRLRYRQYYGTLPWRGESKTIVEAIVD